MGLILLLHDVRDLGVVSHVEVPQQWVLEQRNLVRGRVRGRPSRSDGVWPNFVQSS